MFAPGSRSIDARLAVAGSAGDAWARWRPSSTTRCLGRHRPGSSAVGSLRRDRAARGASQGLRVRGSADLVRRRAIEATAADDRALRSAATRGVPLLSFHGIAPPSTSWWRRSSSAATIRCAEWSSWRRQCSSGTGHAWRRGGRRVDRGWRPPTLHDTRGAGQTPPTALPDDRPAGHPWHNPRHAAYRGRCAVCALREAALLQVAHILEDASRCSGPGSRASTGRRSSNRAGGGSDPTRRASRYATCAAGRRVVAPRRRVRQRCGG